MNISAHHNYPRLWRYALSLSVALASVAFTSGAARWLHVVIDHDEHRSVPCVSTTAATTTPNGQQNTPKSPSCGNEDGHTCPVCVMFATLGTLVDMATAPPLHGIQPIGRLALPGGLPASSILPLLPLSRAPPAR